MALTATKTKNASLVVAGSGENREVAISPGATVREVLETMRLQGYLLSLGPNHPFLGPDENLYQAAPEGATLYATSPAEAGVTRGGPESDSVASARN